MIGRVVFDTSALVGAALKFGSKPHQALMFAFGSCVLYTCEQELAELAEVLNRSSFERYLTRSDRDKFLVLLRERSQIVRIDGIIGTSLGPPCRDPNDDFILFLAVAAQADVIVASDRDLLVLHPWRDIAILTPAQFLSQSEI
jgi:putative PIN family toxin of toxin-antitoxin system